ncbi:unnamed protein product [Sphenostylis stenocarpa]|uniref:Uncharacterized protein n=1 Tax=Sphenostylis stenocarpa TaxID=92480 RepID=A0AA87BAM4_9FABA|nr:unnamed protein product [Sphenostylis stenocarpa]
MQGLSTEHHRGTWVRSAMENVVWAESRVCNLMRVWVAPPGASHGQQWVMGDGWWGPLLHD